MVWSSLLLVLAFVLPAVAAIVLATLVVRAAHRRRLLPADPTKAFAQLAVTAVAIGVLVYGIGSWQGHLVDPRSASEICGGPVARSLQQSPLPLRNWCQLTDGRAFDLVPGWINPVIAFSIAVAALCTVLAVRARARQHNSIPTTTSGG